MNSRRRGFFLLVALLGAGGALFRAAGIEAAVQPTMDPGAVAARDSAAGEDLRATSTIPWSPPRPVAAAETWETALRLPGRIVSLPLSALGYITVRGLIAVEESNAIPRVVAYAHAPAKLGLILTPASLGDRTGFGVKAKLEPPRVRKFFAAEWDGSTLHYSRTRLEAGYGPARLEYGYDWRPQEGFFGIGLDSSPDDESDYASQSQHARLSVKGTPIGKAPWRLSLGGWMGPREMVSRRGRDGARRSFEQPFPALGSSLDRRYEHLVYGASAALDGRTGVPHWTRGGRLATLAPSARAAPRSPAPANREEVANDHP